MSGITKVEVVGERCSGTNFIRSDLIKNVTSLKVIFESKSIKEIEICWLSFLFGSFEDEDTSKVTSFPFKFTGGNVSDPNPCPKTSNVMGANIENDNKITRM